jgi:hypothetical protein
MGNKHALYICPYCKGAHETPSGLARCILDCEEKKKIEEEMAKKAKLDAEKEARKKEVDNAIEKCRELVKAYMHDYGIYSYTSDDDDINPLFSSKFWNWVW